MSQGKLGKFLSQNIIYLVLVVLVAAISMYSPNFLSVTSFRDILIQSSPRIIIALGSAMILITAGFDCCGICLSNTVTRLSTSIL